MSTKMLFSQKILGTSVKELAVFAIAHHPWWGGSRPRPGGGVCIPACTEADTPSRRLLECILVLKKFCHNFVELSD